MLYNVNTFKPEKKTGRIRVAWRDVNWVFGSDDLSPDADVGLPMGAITLLGGSAGVGKTRACVSLLKETVKHFNVKVLFFQLEMPIGQFYDKYIGKEQLPYSKDRFFYMSDSTASEQQMKEIDTLSPDIIVIDSVNKIEGFNNGYGTDAIRDAFSEAAVNHNAHVIFLAHLNGEGNIKGGTNLPHMGDIVLKLTKASDSKDYHIKLLSNCIILQIGKTRFGPSDRMAILQHANHGVNCITANYTKPHNDENILKINDGNGGLKFLSLSEAIEEERKKKEMENNCWTDEELEHNLNKQAEEMMESCDFENDDRDFFQKFCAKLLGWK